MFVYVYRARDTTNYHYHYYYYISLENEQKAIREIEIIVIMMMMMMMYQPSTDEMLFWVEKYSEYNVNIHVYVRRRAYVCLHAMFTCKLRPCTYEYAGCTAIVSILHLHVYTEF